MAYTVEIDECKQDGWTDLLLQFNDASIYQTWSYGSARWGENALSHHVIKKNNEVIALAQVSIKKVPGFSAGIAYIPWGPLWRRKGHSADIENFREAIKCLREEYAIKRGLLLRMAPNVIKESDATFENLFEHQGFSKVVSTRSYRTLRVNITRPLDELRKKLDPKWRNKLSQSEKKGLQVVCGSGADLYEMFLFLQQEMQARKKYVPGVDYEQFGAIQAALPDALKMNIMICKSEGEPVAAAVVSAMGDTGIYLLGATGNKGTQVKGSYLLQWLFIEWLKQKGCEWYDLGGISPDENPGVYNFKAGFSGEDITYIGQYEMCSNSISSLVVTVGELLRGASRR